MPTSTHPFDFSKFFPGMEFFSGGLAGKAPVWPVPTVNVQELEKRVGELKTVLFWLEQNAAALKATIQALEVQKIAEHASKYERERCRPGARLHAAAHPGSGTSPRHRGEKTRSGSRKTGRARSADVVERAEPAVSANGRRQRSGHGPGRA